MSAHAMHSVWKERDGWKVQCPNGRLTFSTKKLALDVAAVARVAALRQEHPEGLPAPVTQEQGDAGRIWRLESLVSRLADYLEESHQADLDENHGDDDLTACPCSYCDAIAEARQLVKEDSDGQS